MPAQGVEAQTVANCLPPRIDANGIEAGAGAQQDGSAERRSRHSRVKQQIEDVIGIDASDAVEISAKSGLNIDKVLEAIVERLPAPKGDINAPR
jgi:GTP-binding protein LepA